ncbi:hypothetical protein ABW20_dc0103882 [Dactylellina cionopaga]|nr:hypothetical protein ABW20_dc0103882 [Dactylellina cionopaga]
MPPKIKLVVPKSDTPPQKPSGLKAVLTYHGLGPKRLSTFHTVPGLKRYVEAELQILKIEFNTEIERVKSMDFPLSKSITFSNIDGYIVEAAESMETGKQTLTELRLIATRHMKQIILIAQDLQEEIQFVVGGELDKNIDIFR